MHMVKKDVMTDIYAENDHIADHVNGYLSEKGIYTVNVMGAPGAGKTTTLEQLIKRLGVRCYVVEGDIESDIDTERLRKEGINASQINTFGACHLDAPLLHNAVHAMTFDEQGILFVENVGNLVCPAEFSIGEDIKLLQVSTADGSDKPYKYPLAFEKANVILLSKTDLLPYLDFDEEFFMKGVRHLNPNVPVFKVCGKTGEGYDEAAKWLKERSGK
ncbi:MAG: hydrogenase nickel incorporation protein HypB [Oscillospiraceae bacterium]|jgi:hydrogenase nickel incorporation protein HypB|nr:hydrogenase nickel incorporation protein HypB [Oscillospiraceae bacterium]